MAFLVCLLDIVFKVFPGLYRTTHAVFTILFNCAFALVLGWATRQRTAHPFYFALIHAAHNRLTFLSS